MAHQLRKCAVSVPSNIAEGFKRKTKDDAKKFYNIAQGSLEEMKYQLLLARDLKYISDEIYESLFDLADEVGRTLYGWIDSQQ